MFASASSASEFRKRLKRSSFGEGDTKDRAKRYLRESGPFSGLDASRRIGQSAHSADVVLDRDHLRAVSAASRNVLLASPISMLMESAQTSGAAR